MIFKALSNENHSTKSSSWEYWSYFLTSATFFLSIPWKPVGRHVNVAYKPQDCSNRFVTEAEVAHHPSGGCGGAWVLWQANLPCTLCGLSTQLHMYKAECYSSPEMTGWLLYTCAVEILGENALGWKVPHNDQILLKCQVALGIEDLSPCGAHMKFKVKKTFVICWVGGWMGFIIVSQSSLSPPSEDQNSPQSKAKSLWHT